MAKIHVWTKQSTDVYDYLIKNGRYTAKRELTPVYSEDHVDVMIKAYDWLAKNGPMSHKRPNDADYPVWVSFSHDATMKPEAGFVIMELLIDEAIITPINIAKWGHILNFGYIPLDEADRKRHLAILGDYNVSDAKAYMTNFYPEIKKEIEDSWKRLFDPAILMGSEACYGTIWEVKEEWILSAAK